MTCEKCDDTGSLSKSLYSDLDCPYCDTAIERAGVEQWAKRETPKASSIDAWLIYLHGKQQRQ